jgi:hypothetical protein
LTLTKFTDSRTSNFDGDSERLRKDAATNLECEVRAYLTVARASQLLFRLP